MTVMYDSTNPFDIPASAEMVAGYVDGIYAWPADGWQRFAGKPQWKIAIFYGTDNGNVLDVEQYDATPAQAPVWVKKRLASGLPAPAILYVNRGNRGAVESALTAAGVTASEVALWVATLDGTQTVPAGPYPVAAVQYANSLLAGGHYDKSIVYQYGAAPQESGVYAVGSVGALDEKWLTDVGTRVARDTENGTGPTTADLLAAIKAVQVPAPSSDAPALAALSAKVDALAALVLRIETALKSA